MLLNNFFYIERLVVGEGLVEATIRIDPGHAILKGHFPSQAVVPGVCMLEMLKEVLEQAWTTKLMLKESSMIKFLAMFVPPTHIQARYEIKYTVSPDGHFIADAELKNNEVVFLKFKGMFCKN